VRESLRQAYGAGPIADRYPAYRFDRALPLRRQSFELTLVDTTLLDTGLLHWRECRQYRRA
jgi:hypothetical protein